MDWFSLEAVSPGVTRITEPFVHPVFRANLYRIEGRDLVVQLDFGNGIASLSAALPRTDKPVLAVASHGHVDHVGSFHEFARRAGHGAERDTFATMADDDTFASWFREMPGVLAARPDESWSIEDFALSPAPLTEVLDDGDVIDLGDRRFAVLHLPGHSPGCIGLLDEANGEFFSADAIYDDQLYDELPHSNVEDYLATMRRLLDLDVGIVHGGHGPSFGKPRMDEIARGYIASKGR